ncbi:MAG: hypothetical protein C4547_03630 [Phycisphaerales bacterium]|nr:MAG: hypothetical protein C4547_03630 [Phycisphaerales bacterium]
MLNVCSGSRAHPGTRRVPGNHRRGTAPTAFYQLGPVAIALSCDVRHVAADFDRLYGRYRRQAVLRHAIDLRVRWTRSPRTLRRHAIISTDGVERFAIRSPAAMLPHVEWAINGAIIETLPGFHQLHAGIVAWRGQGLVMAAAPQSGKSTLTAGLAARGWQYYCDEFALIDAATRRLHAYPKAICVKHGSFEPLARAGLTFALGGDYDKGVKGKVRFIDPATLAGGVGRAPATVRLVIFPRYVEGATPRLIPMSRARAVYEWLQLSFTFGRFGVSEVELFADIMEGAACYGLEAGELGASCDLIERAMRRAAGSVAA